MATCVNSSSLRLFWSREVADACVGALTKHGDKTTDRFERFIFVTASFSAIRAHNALKRVNIRRFGFGNARMNESIYDQDD